MDPSLFDTDEHKYMTDLLLDNVMEAGLTAKALTMEEVVNVDTPSFTADRSKPMKSIQKVIVNPCPPNRSDCCIIELFTENTLHPL